MASARPRYRQWRKARRNYLTQHPFCAYCQQEGRLNEAQVVDHITPHRGNAVLFWDMDNWQPLCKRHHDGAKQAEDKGNPRNGCDLQGNPLRDLAHWKG